jgi:serine/threonine protein kinase/tetratricopeptide (TPR) repeat protein
MAENPLDLEAIFFAARQMPPQDRAAYLDQVCGDDLVLRRRAEQFLNAQGEIGSFLESGAPPLLATIDDPIAERPGTTIGRYKLLEQIGEGGFGVVFMAEQQEPIRRKVALKVLKPGMDSRQVIARFEAERQALALMDHPNIAKVLDAGQTGSGRPFFVMDLVKGLPITDYCDQNQLTPRERLELFLHVCQAVQHAHQKGIIHRDLKPSNVLVTLHDGTPVPKIIDFGIAKALGQQLTDKTLYTGFAQLVGTPLYMSPEQTALSGLDVDTRSDLYSLGVLLYELLTGTTPFDKERLHQVGYDELRRIIREEEPPRPSTRISTLGQAATATSMQRKSDPKRLSQLFRGELDWIVMKCLEKDRNRRYETASALAADVERYLHDEPVQACPPSAWYRLRKLARRNKAALTTAALLAGMLVLGTLVSTWQAFRATEAEGLAKSRLQAETKAKAAANASAREAQKQGKLAENNAKATIRALGQAEANLKRADQNLALALEALDDVYMKDVEDRIIRDRQMDRPERESLERGLKFYERFARQNSGRPQLARVTAKAYRRAGSLRLELGDWKEADAKLTTAIAGFEKLVGQPAQAGDFRQELARCFDLLSDSRVRARRFRKAEPAGRQAVAVWQSLVAAFPKDPGYRFGLATSLLRLGQLIAHRDLHGRCQEIEGLMRRTLEMYKALAAEYPGNVGYRGEVAWVHHELNHYVLCPGGRRQEAVEHQQQAVAILKARAAGSPSNLFYQQALGDQYLELAHRLNEAGQVAQAEGAYNQGLRTYEKLAAESPADRLRVGWAQVYLGNFYRGGNRVKQAEEAYRRAFDVYTKLISDTSTHPSVMWRLPALVQDLSALLQDAGRAEEAGAVLREAAEKCRAALGRFDQWPADRNLPGDRWDFGNSYKQLGRVLQETGRFPEAAEAYRKALGLWEKVYSNPNNADDRRQLALCQAGWLEALVCQAREVENDPKLSEAERRTRAQACRAQARQLLDDGIKRGLHTAASLNETAWRLASHANPKNRDPVWALELAKLAVERDPDNGTILNTLGTAHYRAGNWKAAIAALKEAEELGQGQFFSADAFFIAMANWQLGDKETAGKWYTAGLHWMEQSQDNEEQRRFCAEAATLLGLPQPSPREAKQPAGDDRKLYSLIIAAYPEAAWACLFRGHAYQAKGETHKAQADYNQAVRLYTGIIQRRPKLAHAWTWRGNALHALRQWDKAVADYSKAIDIKTDGAIFWKNRGNAYFAAAQWDKAIADYSKAIELEPHNATSWNERGNTYFAATQWDKAIADYSKAIELQPGNAVLWSNRANAHAELTQWDEASADCAKAIQLNAADANSWYRHALLCLRRNHREGYRTACASMLERFGEDAKALVTDLALWASVLAPDAVKDYPRLLRWVEKLVAAQPKGFAVLNTVGAALYRSGQFSKAIERLNEAQAAYKPADEVRQSIAYVWYFLAMAHQRSGDAESAKTWLAKAVKHSDEAVRKPLSWNRKLTLQLLRREAEEVLKEPVPVKRKQKSE